MSIGIFRAFALNTDGANSLITDLVVDVGTVLASGLVAVLGLIAALIGLMFVFNFIQKKIGRAK